MHAAIADKQEELAELCRRYDVARFEVFGSAARGTGFDPEKSDADFLVEFEPDSRLRPFHQYFDLVDALRNTLGRPVDLVEFGAVRNPNRNIANRSLVRRRQFAARRSAATLALALARRCLWPFIGKDEVLSQVMFRLR